VTASGDGVPLDAAPESLSRRSCWRALGRRCVKPRLHASHVIEIRRDLRRPSLRVVTSQPPCRSFADDEPSASAARCRGRSSRLSRASLRSSRRPRSDTQSSAGKRRECCALKHRAPRSGSDVAAEEPRALIGLPANRNQKNWTETGPVAPEQFSGVLVPEYCDLQAIREIGETGLEPVTARPPSRAQPASADEAQAPGPPAPGGSDGSL
jgi:hypothetical protein